MSYNPFIEPQSSDTLSNYAVYSWKFLATVDTAGTIRFTTDPHRGDFLITDVNIALIQENTPSGGGITFSLGVVPSLYVDLVPSQTTGSLVLYQFVDLNTVATTSAAGPVVPPSTNVLSRVPSASVGVTNYVQVFIGGFYLGARR